MHPSTVDCGSYFCKAGHTCAKGWRNCIPPGSHDCGPEVKGTCREDTSCFTARTDQLEHFEEGKTYCLNEEQLTAVRDKLDAVVGDLRKKLRKQRADRERKREEKKVLAKQKKDVDAWTKEAKEDSRKTEVDVKTAAQSPKTKRHNRSARASTQPPPANSSSNGRLASARREVNNLQNQLDRAKTKHTRKTNQARSQYLDANNDLLHLATKWNNAVAAGDIKEATRLHKKLTTAKRTADRRYKEYQQLKATKVDPAVAAQLQQKIDAASKEVAVLEKEKPLPSSKVDSLNKIPSGKKLSGSNSMSTLATNGSSATSKPTAAAVPKVASSKPVTNPKTSSAPTGGNQKQARKTTSLNPSTQGARHSVTPSPKPIENTNSNLQLKKWFVDETISPYGGANTQFKTVAGNAKYARLAYAAYGGVSPKGWKRQSPSVKTPSGLNVDVFTGPSGETVVAFAGTAGKRDIVNDALLAGQPIYGIPQFNDALQFSRGMLRKGQRVTFVGHSLGGGLAHYVAAELKQPAVAFNPAPIKASLATAGRTDLLNYRNIRNFRSPDDPLTGLTGAVALGPTPVQVNNTPRINAGDGIRGNWIRHSHLSENHSMDSLARAMNAAELVDRYLKQTNP